MGNPEDPNAAFRDTSIERDPSWPSCLALACRAAASAATRAEALVATLEGLRGAVGAERAFLVEVAPPPRGPQAVASVGARAGRRGAFSRSVAVRALAGDRPLFLPDLAHEEGAADAASIRALALRGAVGVPVPRRGAARAAVVLDSRVPLTVPAREWETVGRAFAALVGLVRGIDPGSFDGEDASTRGPGAAPYDGVSAAAVRLDASIRRVARVPLPALVVGPPGSGKELVARALHARGRRSGRPFVAINCAAIPEALLERELFGATRGAYTGADQDHLGLLRQADGGTVLLDEIGDMPPALQAKLLRVVQEGAVRPVGGLGEIAVDVRVVSATHRDLDRLVDEGRFRADLRDRLAVLVLRVPSLAERVEDLPAIARLLLERLSRRCALPRAELSPEAIARLRRHPWPGNVRELEAVLARALVQVDGGAIDASDLELAVDAARAGDRREAAPRAGLERAMIEGALESSRGVLFRAAAAIGWSRQKLHRRMVALGMKPGALGSAGDPERQDSVPPEPAAG